MKVEKMKKKTTHRSFSSYLQGLNLMNYKIAIFNLSTDLVDKLNQIYLKLSVMFTVITINLTNFVYPLEITMAQFSHIVFNSFILNVHNML